MGFLMIKTLLLLVFLSIELLSQKVPGSNNDYYYYQTIGLQNFSLKSPVDGEMNIKPNNLMLQWNRAIGGINYRLQLASDSLFTQSVININKISNNFYVIGNLEQGTSYYWRARALRYSVISEWTDVWNFTTRFEVPVSFLSEADSYILYDSETKILKVRKIILIAQSQPKDDSTDTPIDLQLTWFPNISALDYDFQVSTDSLFNNLVIDSSGITDTFYTITNELENGITYYWHVKGNNPEIESAYWKVRNFTTVPLPPEIPLLVSPANNETDIDSNLVILDWGASARAVTYTLQFSDIDDFSNLIIDENGLTATQDTVSDLNEATVYYWKVMAHNSGGDSDWSDSFQFRTTYPAIPLLDFDDKQLISSDSKNIKVKQN